MICSNRPRRRCRNKEEADVAEPLFKSQDDVSSVISKDSGEDHVPEEDFVPEDAALEDHWTEEEIKDIYNVH